MEYEIAEDFEQIAVKKLGCGLGSELKESRATDSRKAYSIEACDELQAGLLQLERDKLRLLEAESLIQQAIQLEASGQSLRAWRLLLTLYALDYEHQYDNVADMPFYDLAKSLAAA